MSSHNGATPPGYVVRIVAAAGDRRASISIEGHGAIDDEVAARLTTRVCEEVFLADEDGEDDGDGDVPASTRRF